MFKSIDLSGNLTDSMSQDSHECAPKNLDRKCKSCKQHLESPRGLSCFHAFRNANEAAESNSMICPDCKQPNTVYAGPTSSHYDYALNSVHDLNSDELRSDAKQQIRNEIEQLFMGVEVKVEEAVKDLSISLVDLQRQLDTVRVQIEDKSQTFKQILGICRDYAFDALDTVPSARELKITDLLDDMQTAADNIEKTCGSTKIALTNANCLELLGLKNIIETQIWNMMKYCGACGVNVDFSLGVHANFPNDVPKSSSMQRGTSAGLLNVSMLNGFMPPSALISPIGAIPAAVSTQRNGDSHSLMQIRYLFGSLGTLNVQFNSPHGFCLGADEEIVVADTNNHRIGVFAKNGAFKFHFGVPGKSDGELWLPRKVAVSRKADNQFVVCDRGDERSRMQIFSKNGQFIKRIFITFIGIVVCLEIANDGRIVVIDSVDPSVYFLSDDGTLLTWFKCGSYVIEPSDVAISGSHLYISDYKGNSVAVFQEDGTFQKRIGHNTIIRYPNGIYVSEPDGDVLICDSHGNRFHVACYSSDGTLQSEHICPHIKVSRCCGLKMTSEGYLVTLAKNNHHVLVLNTFYSVQQPQHGLRKQIAEK